MTLGSVDVIIRALNAAGVRYLVAGGLAVNAHGYLRLTMDVDLVVQLVPENIGRAFAVLAGLGYRPSVPVTAEQFARPEQRERWMREKSMTVLQLWSDAHRETSIDLFVAEPFDFDDEHRRAWRRELAAGVEVPFISLATLIRMKEQAGRPQDLIDVEHLRIREEQQRGGS
ncbi:MAG: hypothetical protein U1F11_06360 [Steroidobacteraceae bacterium]